MIKGAFWVFTHTRSLVASQKAKEVCAFCVTTNKQSKKAKLKLYDFVGKGFLPGFPVL